MDHDARKAQRKDELFEKYNTRAMEQGFARQGEYFLRTVDLLDAVDPDWVEAWLTFVYDYMYGRGVIEDRTRTLITIGACIAGGHFEQLPNHMRTAVTLGVEPRELLEACLQSSIYVGMPSMRKAVTVYRELMNELGLAAYPDSPFAYIADA